VRKRTLLAGLISDRSARRTLYDRMFANILRWTYVWPCWNTCECCCV